MDFWTATERMIKAGYMSSSLVPRLYPAHARRRGLVSQVESKSLLKHGVANQIAERHLLE